MKPWNRPTLTWCAVGAAALVGACSEEEASPARPMIAADAGSDASASAAGIVYRSAVQPVRTVAEALPGIFIPPYLDCRAPATGDQATQADGKVCTYVSLAACTEPGKYFPSYASCDVVRRQRPFWAAPPAKQPRADDPRLADASYVAELAWVTSQVAASGCTCCHDARIDGKSAQWDISNGPIWLDTLSDTGLALFTGLADSSVLGAYPPADNHGFDRDKVGIPSTDPTRMKAFMMAELAHRGLTESWARSVPPFGGPIYANSIKKPEACQAGEGVDSDGKLLWTGGEARYLYVLEQGSKNPGVPPNLDLPAGTLWRLDVLASAQPLASGARFGQTPAGSFQVFPDALPAAALQVGKTYQLVVLRDVGLTLANCLFEFGRPVAPAPVGPAPQPDAAVSSYPDAGSSDAGVGSDAAAMCSPAGGDAKGFGAACTDTTNHTDCSCQANYCSKSPFDAKGYCSVTGCLQNPSLCPSGWKCTDLSVFQAGLPSVCSKP